MTGGLGMPCFLACISGGGRRPVRGWGLDVYKRQNVGSESAIVFDQREMPNGVSRFLFFCPWNLKEEREGCKMCIRDRA